MTVPTIEGEIAYIVPPSRLAEHLARAPNGAAAARSYRGEQEHALEVRTVRVSDVRADLDGPLSVADQIKARGWAVRRHASAHAGRVEDVRGIEAYLAECCDLVKAELGCSRVYTWNSTVRRADRRAPVPVTRQLAPETGVVPTARVQPPASFAHVDQEAAWAAVVVGRATGVDATTFKRSMIVNLWRPLKGPVTNSPLAMLDYRTLDPSDLHAVPDAYGVGLHVSFHPAQRWAYVRQQATDEVVFLKCYDSAQGANGDALVAAHVALEIGEQDMAGLKIGHMGPRESVEVRMIAVWQ
ncbi:hypothetical protein Q5752_005044 [Cryptotrichosporon argae]